jgi:hypothetical protein
MVNKRYSILFHRRSMVNKRYCILLHRRSMVNKRELQFHSYV